jgi:hypothetical protein
MAFAVIIILNNYTAKNLALSPSLVTLAERGKLLAYVGIIQNSNTMNE